MWRPFLVVPLLLGSVLLSACGPSATISPVIARGEGSQTYTIDYSSDIRQINYTGNWVNGRPQGRGQYTNTLTWANSRLKPITTTCSGEFGDALKPDPRPAGINFWQGSNWIYGRGVSKTVGNFSSEYEGEFVSNLAEGLACHRYGKGTLFSGGTSISGTFNGDLVPGPCRAEGKDWGAISGTCSNDPQGIYKDIQNQVVTSVSSPVMLIAGPAVYTDTDGVHYEGNFNRGLSKSGTYRVSRPGQHPMIALYDKDMLRAEYPPEEVLEKKAMRCGSWYLMSGSCPNKQWSGKVVAYSVSDGGTWKLQGDFNKDVPNGLVEITAMNSDNRIIGTMAPLTNRELSYTQGEIWRDGAMQYKGPMKGMGPDGTGLCRYEGKLEACEHAEGERVDALYKMREENRKMAQQLQLQQQQLAAARQQQAAPQNNANSNSSFQWGKALALGSGSLIGGVNKLSSEAQVKIASGIIQDSMGGQQGMSSTQAATRSIGGGGPVASGGSASSGGNSSSQKQAAASCANEYDGPNSDPQLDSFCKLAAFNACIHRKTGITDYDAQGRSSCQQLRGLISSTSGNYQCRYCPYPY